MFEERNWLLLFRGMKMRRIAIGQTFSVSGIGEPRCCRIDLRAVGSMNEELVV